MKTLISTRRSTDVAMKPPQQGERVSGESPGAVEEDRSTAQGRIISASYRAIVGCHHQTVANELRQNIS